MKRSIPRSLINKAASPNVDGAADDVGQTKGDSEAQISSTAPPGFRGAGSAWKSGALAQSQAAIERNREELIADILTGRHELSLSSDQISDPLGTDRRDDWIEQDAFKSLMASIRDNGQDTPILVWPEDPKWTPDSLDPTGTDGVPFVLLTGRRRHAAAKQLGLKLRAILAPSNFRNAEDSRFEMLFLRFRENEERENLSAFERLLSIGEMYETLNSVGAGPKVTAVSFAKRVGVHESVVSRARAVFAARDKILNTFKNVYDMSFRDLQSALATLDSGPNSTAKPKPKKLLVKRKIGPRNLSVTSVNGNLTIKAAGIRIDQQRLEGLGDLVANYLSKQEAEQNGH